MSSRVVSVVITCYNLERYIGAAIDSVLAQRYSGSVEIIVVDDVSTDRSADIIRGYESVRYLRPSSNLGVLLATTFGLREADGDLVFFLDGDDVWHADKLRLAVDRFDSDPLLALLTHDIEYIDSQGNSLPSVSRSLKVMGTSCADGNDQIRKGILLHADYVWLGSAYSIRKSLVDAKAFCDWAERLPDPGNTYQDWPLAYWAASQPGVRMGYIPQKLLMYRLHGANHSGDARTVEKARRNVLRTCNTMEATRAIGQSARLPSSVMRIAHRKMRYYRYLVDLYAGKRYVASCGFVRSLPYLLSGPESVLKETVRFIGVQVLGLRHFLSLAKIRAMRSLT